MPEEPLGLPDARRTPSGPLGTTFTVTVLAGGLKPFRPMSRSRFFNRPPMGPKQAHENAGGISGPSWCPQVPIRYIGHHPHNDRSHGGAKALTTSSKSRVFNRPQKGPRKDRAGALTTSDASGCPYDHIRPVGNHHKRAQSTLVPSPRVARTQRVATTPRVAAARRVARAPRVGPGTIFQAATYGPKFLKSAPGPAQPDALKPFRAPKPGSVTTCGSAPGPAQARPPPRPSRARYPLRHGRP